MKCSCSWIVLSLLGVTGCVVGVPPGEARGAFDGGDPLGPACSPVIDGAFTHLDDECAQRGFVEWAVEPVRGRFGDLYVDVRDGGELVVLNDWHLRDDAPADPDMYNLFCLETNVGMFEIRVFGDDRVEAWRDSEPWTGIRGASGFGPSPLTPRPHSIFEFRLATLPETMTVYEKDPAPGPIGMAAPPPDVSLSSYGTCFEGSAPPIAHNLVTEPTRFRFELSPTGVVSAGTTSAPLVLGTSASTVVPGELVTVLGVGFTDTRGEVWVDDTPATVVEWGDTRVTFTVPDAVGSFDVQVVADGVPSNLRALDVVDTSCEPRCFGECGDDGCGGSCGTCDAGSSCDLEAQACREDGPG